MNTKKQNVGRGGHSANWLPMLTPAGQQTGFWESNAKAWDWSRAVGQRWWKTLPTE